MGHWLRVTAWAGLCALAGSAVAPTAAVAQGRYQPEGPARRAYEGAEGSRQQAEALDRAGDAAGAAAKFREALAGFKAALEADADYVAAYAQAGRVAYRLNTPEAALDLLADGLARRPRQPDLMFWRGQNLVAAGQAAEGVPLLEQVAANHPDAWPEVFLALGNHYYRAEDFRAAEPSFAEYVRRNPEAIEVRAKLGNTYFRLQNYAGALAEFEAVRRRKPDDVRVLVNIGNAQVQLGRYEAAVATLERALALDPQRQSALFNLAHSHFKLGHFAQALPYYERFRAKQPKDFNGHYFAGSALMALGRDAEAIQALEAAAALQPEQVHPIYKIGLIHLKAKRAAEAKARFDAALAIKAEDPWVISGLGTVARQQGDLAQAVALHARAASLAPEKARLQANLALSAWRAGDLPRGLQAIDKALGLDAEDAWVRGVGATLHAAQAQALAAAGDLPGALAQADTAVRLAPGDATALANRALLRLAQGDAAGATADAEAATQAAPEDARAALALGRVRLAAGDGPGALALLEAAWTRGPSAAVAVSLGDARLQTGATSEAVAGLMDAAKQWPEDPAVGRWLGAARFARAWGDVAAGRAARRDAGDLRAALAVADGLDATTNARLRYAAAITALRGGDGAAARQHLGALSAALRGGVPVAAVLAGAPGEHLDLLRARAAIMARKDANALEILSGVAAARRKDSEGARLARVAHLRLGEAAVQQGALGAAADHFKRAQAASPTPWTRHHQATVQYLQGKQRPAIKAWRAVSGQVPEAHFNLGVALEQAGDHAGAYAAFARFGRLGRPESEAAQRVADAKARIFGFTAEAAP